MENILEVLKKEKECSLEYKVYCSRICKSCPNFVEDDERKEFYDKIENMLKGGK